MNATQTTLSVDVHSPFDGRLVGHVLASSSADVDRAVGRALAALHAPIPAFERAEILDRAAAIVRSRRDELATIICGESGKPLAAAVVEAERAVDTLTFSAVEARTLSGDVIPMEASASGAGHLAFTTRRPIGVVAAITPFNFPLNLSCHKIGPAIAAGCPIVHKPASATPLSAVALHSIMLEAGLPEDHYHLLIGAGSDVGAQLTHDPRVAMVTFTGSSDVGWALRANLPRKRVSLELGNSTPFIICADAPLDDIADMVAQHGFGFAGQSCISIQRVIVEHSIYEQAIEAIATRVSALTFGDPASSDTSVGPVIDAGAAERIRTWIARAIDAGARPVVGIGSPSEQYPWPDTPTMVEPTVLADVTPAMDVFQHELFGPGVVITPFLGDDEAVALANGTDYGLQAGIASHDVTRALAIADRLDFGGVTINEAPTYRADQMPYGGVKASGTTREGPRYAVREMTESHLIVVKR